MRNNKGAAPIPPIPHLRPDRQGRFRPRGEPGAQSGGQSRSPYTLAYAGGYIDCASFHSVQTYVVETASVSLVGRRHEAHRGHLVDAGSIPAPHFTIHGEGVQSDGCAMCCVESPVVGKSRWEFSVGAMVVARAGSPAPPTIVKWRCCNTSHGGVLARWSLDAR